MVRDTNWSGYRTAAWGGIALLGLAMLAVAAQAKWLPLASLGGFLAFALFFVLQESKLPTLFDLIVVLAALINAGGWAWDLYNQPGLYDEVAHFFTIFAVTLALGYLWYNELMSSFYQHRVIFVVTVASLGIAIGALWEVVEWLADMVVAKQIVSGYFDTITDIGLDSLGALLAALFNLYGLNERAAAEKRPRTPSLRT